MNKQQEIIDAGIYLLNNNLVARTWGNVSSRIDDKKFYITPSGKGYNDLKLNDIVEVNILDASYDHNKIKPSSEKGCHAACYKIREDINYIIHTHQFYASAIGAEGFGVELFDDSFIPCAEYGLPGTKKLINNVIKCVKKNITSDIILLEKHGVLIFGKTMEDAIKKAEYLEKECQKKFEQRVKEVVIPKKMPAFIDDYAQLIPNHNPNEDKEALDIVTRKNAAAYLYVKDSKPLSFFDRTIQHLVYEYKYSKLKDK